MVYVLMLLGSFLHEQPQGLFSLHSSLVFQEKGYRYRLSEIIVQRRSRYLTNFTNNLSVYHLPETVLLSVQY